MIRRASEGVTFSKVMFGGPGAIEARQILNTPEEFLGHGRLFNHIVLHPGVTLGRHRHTNDFEVYYILRGCGTYCDNGVDVEVGPGDVTICPEGEEHALTNTGSEDLEMIALVLFDKKNA